MNIKIWIYFYFTCLLLQIALGYQEINRYCPTDDKFQYCMILYKVEAGLTWADAINKCEQLDMEFLAIYDFTTQIHVNELSNQSPFIHVKAWIAGHKNDNSVAWQSINPFSNFSYGKPIDDKQNNTHNCLVGRFYSQHTLNYEAVPCKLQRDYHVICQVNSNIRCKEGDPIKKGNICYIRVQHTGSITWFEAQGICQEQYGDLIHELPPSYSHSGLERILPLAQYYWIGVWRRPWVWITRGGVETPMRYFNWYQEAGGYSSGKCTHINKKGFSWKNVKCTQKIEYIICKTDNPMVEQPRTKSQSTEGQAQTNMASTSMVAESLSHITAITSQPNVGDEGLKLEYIAMLAVGVILVVVNVIVIVFIRKRRQETSETPPNVHPSDLESNDYIEINEYLSGTTNNQSAQQDNGQPDVTNAVSGDTNLYSLAGTVSRDHEATPVCHQVTSHGDEYALPNMNRPRRDHLDCIMVDNTQYGSYN